MEIYLGRVLYAPVSRLSLCCRPCGVARCLFPFFSRAQIKTTQRERANTAVQKSMSKRSRKRKQQASHDWTRAPHPFLSFLKKREKEVPKGAQRSALQRRGCPSAQKQCAPRVHLGKEKKKKNSSWSGFLSRCCIQFQSSGAVVGRAREMVLPLVCVCARAIHDILPTERPTQGATSKRAKKGPAKIVGIFYCRCCLP